MNDRYPSKWQGGHHRGSVKTLPNFYRVTMSPPIGTQYTRVFYFTQPKRTPKNAYEVCNNEKDALKMANDWLAKESVKLGTTRNMYRYIDKNTIEVKSSFDKTFKINSVHLDKVAKYPIMLKQKKIKNAESKYYVTCQDKKKHFTLLSLITDNDNSIYRNGDTLDMRDDNIFEVGSVRQVINDNKTKQANDDKSKQANNDNKTKQVNNDNNNDKIKKKTSEKSNVFDPDENDLDLQVWYLETYHIYKTLPRGIWMLGKPSGTVVKNHFNKYEGRIQVGKSRKYVSKGGFPPTKHGKKLAHDWRIKNSFLAGETKNMIKNIGKSKVKVKLTKDLEMITNEELVPLIQKVAIYASKGQFSDYYAGTNFNNKSKLFHNLITGYDMVDHIDGNPLNNCYENLRWCNHALNNSNKHTDTELGILISPKHARDYLYLTVKINGYPYNQQMYGRSAVLKGKELEKLRKIAVKLRDYIRIGKYDEEIYPYINLDTMKTIKAQCDWELNCINFDTTKLEKNLKRIDLDKSDVSNILLKFKETRAIQINAIMQRRRDAINNKILK